MARRIIIEFDLPPDARSLIHQIRNFGEDLYRQCRDEGWATISLEEIDRATSQLRVTVRSKRRVRRTMRMIEQLLETHYLKSRARLSETDLVA